MSFDHAFQVLDRLVSTFRAQEIFKQLAAANVSVVIKFTSDGVTWIELIDESAGNGRQRHSVSRNDPPWRFYG